MRAGITAFTASVLINVAALGSFESAGTQYVQSQLLAQKENQDKSGPIQFEFVEAPAKPAPRKPEKTGKISSRDSAAQDMAQKKENAASELIPQIESKGPADQLEQHRFEPTQAPAAESKPSLEQPVPVSQTKEEQAGEEEKKQPGLTEKTEIADLPKAEAKIADSAKTPSVLSPSSLPQAPHAGTAGIDRINTQAVSRSASHGAQLNGITSFEATGSGMGQYMKNMKDKIWFAWFPYLAFHFPKDFRSADAVVQFTLNKAGEVKMVKVVDAQGSPVFAAFCVEALQHAGSFGPLPNEILDLIGRDELEVKFAFHFW